MWQTEINNSIKVLSEGGVLLCPTDTIWGLHANALFPKNMDKIAEIKMRPPTKTFITLFADWQNLLFYLPGAAKFRSFIDRYTDRPTTYIVSGFSEELQHLKSTDGFLAFRIPQSGFVSGLLKQLSFPLISTSANLSGEPSPQTFKEISPEVISRVDYVVDELLMPDIATHSSRILKINEDGAVEVIRE